MARPVRKPQRPEPGSGRPSVVLCVLLACAVGAVYAQVWQFDFIMLDDPQHVTENPYVRGGLTASNLVWAFTTRITANWLPLTWASLMLDTTIYGGVRAGGYHLTNAVLHTANTVLLFVFLVRVTQSQGRSAFVAALFGLHPLHVESVAWVTERKDVLSVFFGLLSLLAYARYVQSGRKLRLAAALGWLVCSLLSKQTLVTLPFVFLLLDFWPLRRDFSAHGVVGLVLEKVPFLAACAVACAITMTAQAHGSAIAPLEAIPLRWRLSNAVVAYVLYLWQAIYPQRLAVFYPHPRDTLAGPMVLGAAAVFVAISAAAVLLRRRFPFLFVGWAWYVGTLVPMIGIVQIGSQQMADRYTYFPLIGVFLTMTWSVAEIVRAESLRDQILPGAGIAILAVLAVASFAQVGDWRDNETLFSHAIDCGRDSAVARSGLGTVLLSRGDAAAGIPMLEAAVRMDPDQPQWRFNLAIGLQTVERPREAAQSYRAVIAFGRRDEIEARAHNNLGWIVWNQEHDAAAAKRHFLDAIEMDPWLLPAYLNLSKLCRETGSPSEADRYRQRAMEIDPSSANPRGAGGEAD